MHALFVALGSAAEQLSDSDPLAFLETPADCEHRVVRSPDGFLAAVCAPSGQGRGMAWSSPGKADLLLDGYFLDGDSQVADLPPPFSSPLEAFEVKGAKAALDDYVAGSFNLAYLSARDHECWVASDRGSSIPLYWAALPGGHVLSTSALAILATGLITSEPDWVGCAGWTYYRQGVLERHFLRDIRLFPRNTALRWSGGRTQLLALAHHPAKATPDAHPVGTRTMAGLVRNACARVVDLAPPVAHLQSAGMDSRLVMAALPDDVTPPCFTYGRPDSTEVAIAEQVARAHGAPWTHHCPSGDEVADVVDQLFVASGVIATPERFLIARRMAEEGFRSVLDGLAGNVLLGGTAYQCDGSFGLVSRMARFGTVFVDQSVRRVGLERIAQDLSRHVSFVNDLDSAYPFLSVDFAHQIRSQRGRLLEDIQAECEELNEGNDSLAILYGRFIRQTQERHAVVLQGALCRPFLRILCPLSNDTPLLDAALGLPPSWTAYRRYQIDLIRKEFQPYGDIPFGESLVALRRSPIVHGCHRRLARTANRNRLVASVFSRVPVPMGNWTHWLRTSARLRDRLEQILIDAGVADRRRLADYLSGIAEGRIVGTGQLFILASVAEWLNRPSPYRRQG